jgi:hypothetical protein
MNAWKLVRAVPVRVDPEAVLYVALGAGLGAVSAPAAVCVGCAAGTGAAFGAACYGVTKAVQVGWRR